MTWMYKVDDRQLDDPGGKGLRDRHGSACLDRQDMISEPGERAGGCLSGTTSFTYSI